MKYIHLTAILSCLPVISATAVASQYPSVALPLSALFDNQAASADGTADFDAHGATFDSQYLPPGPWVHDGITVRRKFIRTSSWSDELCSTTFRVPGATQTTTSSQMARFFSSKSRLMSMSSIWFTRETPPEASLSSVYPPRSNLGHSRRPRICSEFYVKFRRQQHSATTAYGSTV